MSFLFVGRNGLRGENLSFSKDKHHCLFSLLQLVGKGRGKVSVGGSQQGKLLSAMVTESVRKMTGTAVTGKSPTQVPHLVSCCVGRVASQAATVDVCFCVGRIFCLVLSSLVSRWLLLLRIEFNAGETNIELLNQE